MALLPRHWDFQVTSKASHFFLKKLKKDCDCYQKEMREDCVSLGHKTHYTLFFFRSEGRD